MRHPQRCETRFWSHVDKSGDCWMWTAFRNHKGYGKFSMRPKTLMAHRYSWELAHGPVPVGLCVLHRCDVPACVRPDHLFLGTKVENNADRDRKGRHRAVSLFGSANPAAKLSDDEVRAIRFLRERGMTLRKIAEIAGISSSYVGDLVRTACRRTA